MSHKQSPKISEPEPSEINQPNITVVMDAGSRGEKIICGYIEKSRSRAGTRTQE